MNSKSRRIAALLTCIAFNVLQVSQWAVAAPVDLADSPMAVRNTAKPNIMFVLDNSGSMTWPSMTGNDGWTFYPWTFIDHYDYQVNSLAYNPTIRYVPGVDSNGVSLGNANPASASVEPYLGRPSYNVEESCYTNTAAPPVNLFFLACGSYDATFRPYGPFRHFSYYYQYTGGGSPTRGTYNVGTGVWTPSATSNNAAVYTRVEILPGNTYPKGSDRSDCAGAVCTYAEEIQNFANWFSYYRTRMLVVKTSMGSAFSLLDNNYRVGFSTINESGTSLSNDRRSSGNPRGEYFLDINDFSGSQRSTWFSRLYSIDPNGGTPLQKALQRVGEYYRTGSMGYSRVGSTDPIQYSCQHTYAILSTDGYWNDFANNAVAVGDVDGRSVPTVPTSALNPVPDPGVTSGVAWPNQFRDANTVSNTLADVAAYYWITDLRSSGTVGTNNQPVNDSDKASWQHMTTYTIGLGADGTIPYQEDYLTATTGFYYDLINGTNTRAPGVPATWPRPINDDPTAIDDMWHAAVNGHGKYFSATNPTTIRSSLVGVLNSIVEREGAAAAVAVANPNITTTSNLSYASEYNSGTWTGDLNAYPIDINTGVVSTVGRWSGGAQGLLDAKTASSRVIVTHSGLAGTGRGEAFQPASMTGGITSTQEDFLNSTNSPPGPTDKLNVLAYLRGDRSREGTDYRTRSHLLGDIINAEPVVVSPPSKNYADNGYASFASFYRTRSTVLFQPANDGMVHAFDGNSGDELWAYIPSLLFNGPSKLVDLTKKSGFTHKYLIDGTPALDDVDIANTQGAGGTPNWRTMVVGGLGKGGRGYYALDVTNPNPGAESAAVNNVAWEFPNASTTSTVVDVTRPDGYFPSGLVLNSAMIGFTYGKPILTKTKAHGWVVLVSSGYNNGSDTGSTGHGYMFVLNAKTGAVLHVFDTSTGSGSVGGTPSAPSGLAHISAWADNPRGDNTVTYAYAGDLNGDVWRFNLNDASTANWSVKRLATLQDASSTPQPVTTAPELAQFYADGAVRRVVYVGTGKYLGDSDVGTTGVQTVYGLVDDLSVPSGNTPVHGSVTRSQLQQQVMTGTNPRTTTSVVPVNYATKRGWYIDLNVAGERVNTDPQLVVGTLVFTTNIPSSDVCIPGGSSYLNVLDYKTGGIVRDGANSLSTFLGNYLASRATLIRLPNGRIKALVRLSNRQTDSRDGPSSNLNPVPRRVSWREIIY